jgi:imidazole glycerol-phosphate synthase subunit HisH
MIGIVDYGGGNLRSVYNAFRYIGEAVKVCGSPADLDAADRVVLPGVGSSKDAMDSLKRGGYADSIKRNISAGKPFLGICLGLQLLFDFSEEAGGCNCLGLVPGVVKLFDRDRGVKVPQIGWNTVKFSLNNCPIFRGVDDRSYFYFVHSYYCHSEDSRYVAGVTSYGVDYTSALWKDNLFALQFHPERSQKNGLKILENFSRL